MPQQAEGVHRLKDILVEEVSLVDHAANKRRFLLVKRNGDMDELKPNGRGGFTRVKKADDDEEKKKAKEEEDEEKAKGKKPPPFPPPKPGAKAPEDEEKAAKADDDDEDEEKGAFGNDDEEKKKAEKADPAGEKLVEELRAYCEELSSLADALEEEEADEPSDVHQKKMMGMHKKFGGMVDKYCSAGGKEGAKKRALSKAMATLQALLGELMATSGKDNEHKPDPGDPQGTPKGWSPTNPSMVPTGAPGTAGGWTGGKAAKHIEALTKSVSHLTQIAKTQSAEIERLKSGGARSNALPVEKNRRRESQDCSWPMDMNRPIDRGSVAKSESFFDED